MEPFNFMESLTGVAAVTMSLAIPIIAIVAAMVISLVSLRNRNRERMKMIEQGIIPPSPKKKQSTYYGLLITGAILLAFGLALFIGELMSHSSDFEGGFIFGFVGIALLVCFVIIRIVRKKEKSLPEPEKPEEPPSAIT